MEKNISIIQGLTAADQANPIRITDAGELKTSGGINPDQIGFDGSPTTDPQTGNTAQYINAPVFRSTDYNGMYWGHTKFGAGNINVNDSDMKILVEQGKQFITYQTFSVDTTSLTTEADYITWVNSRIMDWINAHGPRYDDMTITSVGSATKFFLIMTIVRYY